MKKNSKMLNLGLLLVFQTGQANEKIVFCVKKKNKKTTGFEDEIPSLFPSSFLFVTHKLKLFSKSE